MSAMSDVLENKLIDHIFRGMSWSAPTNLYVALYTSATDDADGGTEVSGGNYGRAALNPLFSNWEGTNAEVTNTPSAGTSGHTQNAVAINFNAPSANWGQVTHFGIHTSASGTGNRLFHGSLTTPKTINNGDPAPSFAIGDLDITLA